MVVSAHGVIGQWIDLSWWTHEAISPALVIKGAMGTLN